MILGQITSLESSTRDNFALREAIKYQIARFDKATEGVADDATVLLAAIKCIDAIEALLGAMRFEAIGADVTENRFGNNA